MRNPPFCLADAEVSYEVTLNRNHFPKSYYPSGVMEAQGGDFDMRTGFLDIPCVEFTPRGY